MPLKKPSASKPGPKRRAASTVRKKKIAVLKRRLQIQTRQGLHARPAALFAQVANRFESSIRVKKGRRVVDGKSIMGLLTLAAASGSMLDVSIEGPDSQEALRALEQVVARREVPTLVTVVRHPTAPSGSTKRRLDGAAGSS